VGRELTDDAAIEQAARQLQGRGARNVLVSLGGDGALLVDEGGAVHRAPAVGGKPVNTVGAGDSMVAGFLAGAPLGYDYALRLGLAAGGATATSPKLATKKEIETLL
jgi:1-phosphofructokinase